MNCIEVWLNILYILHVFNHTSIQFFLVSQFLNTKEPVVGYMVDKMQATKLYLCIISCQTSKNTSLGTPVHKVNDRRVVSVFLLESFPVFLQNLYSTFTDDGIWVR